MDLRSLRYFLAVANEKSFAKAAKDVAISQPALSMQIKALEKELGKELFIRVPNGNRILSLSEEGLVLKQRAEEILSLVDKTEKEISQNTETIIGDIYIGAGESDSFRFVAQSAKELSRLYPDIHYHFQSGNASYVKEMLENGLLDFGIVFGSVNPDEFNSIPLPYKDHWGVLLLKEDPLARKRAISPEDLKERALILSQQGDLSTWIGEDMSKLNVIATYNLLFNASLLVEAGLGIAIGLEKIIHTSNDSPLCFRPLTPKYQANLRIIWKKGKILSKAAQKLIDLLQKKALENPEESV